MEICVFSKHLQEYGFPELGAALKSIGVSGVDLTVRPGGHVEPAEVADKLPEAAEALKAEGVSVAMITTGITELDGDARAVLETAAALGIRFYKFGYFYYEGFGTIDAGLADARAKLADLASFSAETGIWGGYHNHSGKDFIGACLSHVADLLTEAEPEGAGVFFDVGHATAEGAKGSWIQALDYLSDRVRMVALKDLKLDFTPGANPWETAPMGEGVAPWREICAALHQIEDQLGPVSIHAEYDRPAAEVLKMAAADKVFFEKVWAETAAGFSPDA